MQRFLVAPLCLGAVIASGQVGRISGTVAGEGGRPLRGEIVAVAPMRGLRVQPAITNEHGGFSIEVPAGRVVLVARADEYVSAERELLVLAGANPSVTFNLERAGSISGRVYDETGAGVPGARVSVHYPGQRRMWSFEDENGPAVADSLGYFTLPAVARGRPFVLQAESAARLPSATGPLTLRTPEMQGVVLMVSRRGSVVRGRILDAAGRPVAGAAVRLRAKPADGEFLPEERQTLAVMRSTNRAATSAVDGTWVFAGVPAGRAVITAQAAARRAAAEASVRAGEAVELTLTLR